MMVGEPQIFGQIKTAYRQACQAGTIGRCLHPILQQVFTVSKRVRTNTSINRKPISIAYAAVYLAKQCLTDLSSDSAMLIGTGETMQLVAQYLQGAGVKRFFIANRTPSHAEKILAHTNKHILPISDIPHYLAQVDIVISATACPLPFITRRWVQDALAQGQRKNLLLLDLAVPRDMEAGIANLEHVQLYNIDDLQHLSLKHAHHRQTAAGQAEKIIEQELDTYLVQQKARHADRAICQYREHIHRLGQQHCQHAKQQLRLGHTPEVVIERLTHRLVQQFLHQPSERLRQAASQDHNDYLSLIDYLFSDESITTT